MKHCCGPNKVFTLAEGFELQESLLRNAPRNLNCKLCTRNMHRHKDSSTVQCYDNPNLLKIDDFSTWHLFFLLFLYHWEILASLGPFRISIWSWRTASIAGNRLSMMYNSSNNQWEAAFIAAGENVYVANRFHRNSVSCKVGGKLYCEVSTVARVLATCREVQGY